MRTTSAYAENTECLIRTEDGNRNYLRVRGEYPPQGSKRPIGKGNYLRVRGEYFGEFFGDGVGTELPPRTRRILSPAAATEPPLGTTSAYAENTEGQVTIDFPDTELPPRTRRIQDRHVDIATGVGTTSAYAENTQPDPTPETPAGNYLRVRGEYRTLGRPNVGGKELPPRTRRIPFAEGHEHLLGGTTSAYAENTNPIWI